MHHQRNGGTAGVVPRPEPFDRTGQLIDIALVDLRGRRPILGLDDEVTKLAEAPEDIRSVAVLCFRALTAEAQMPRELHESLLEGRRCPGSKNEVVSDPVQPYEHRIPIGIVSREVLY